MTQDENNNMKRVQVTLNERQLEIINLLKGELGNSEAEIIRNIVLSWLSEKSFISTMAKKKIEDMK